MPELPEVEAARRVLEEHCVGKRIVRCSAADDTKVIDGIAPAQLEEALVGRTIAAARRKGKNLWLALDSPPSPTFQFGYKQHLDVIFATGMAGAISVKGVELSKYKRSAVSPTEEWPSKYSKLFVEPEAVPPISELGPDALFEPMQLDGFVQSLRRKNVPIKSLLLDQSFMSGIGNWIADEVLYQARIHPMQTPSKLSKEKCKALHRCIKEVIEESVVLGADSSEFPENWIFHSREKKPSKAFVDGKKIDFITVGGRTSAYVPELQKLDGVDGAAASSLKRSKDKVENYDDTKSKKGRNTAKEGKKEPKQMCTGDQEEEDKPAKQTAKATKGPSKKDVNTCNDDHEEDGENREAKPAKKGRKQSLKAAKASCYKAVSTHDDAVDEDDQEDGEDAKPAKRGRKQPAKRS